MIPNREQVRAMLGQALSEAQRKHAMRLTELHLELFDPHPETARALRDLVAELSAGTIATGVQVVAFRAASRLFVGTAVASASVAMPTKPSAPTAASWAC